MASLFSHGDVPDGLHPCLTKALARALASFWGSAPLSFNVFWLLLRGLILASSWESQSRAGLDLASHIISLHFSHSSSVF